MLTYPKIITAKLGLGRITDYRVQGRTKHKLSDILLTLFLAVICGERSWKGVHTFGVMNEADLRDKFMPGLKSIPSVDTIARTVSNLDSVQLSTEFSRLSVEFLRRYRQRPPGRRPKGSPPDLLSMDGKLLRGAIEPGESKSHVHIVNAVIGFVTLVCRRVHEKSNEITIFPVILEMLDKHGLLSGKVVSIDAMGCQRDLVKDILKHKADYLINLKGNQSKMHEDVKSLFDVGPKQYKGEIEFERFETAFEKSPKGNLVSKMTSLVRVVPGLVTEWLASHEAWEGLKAVVKVETFTKKKEGDAPELSDVRYFITSAVLDPEQMLRLITSHWQVETLHKVLDDMTDFGEDHCKIYRKGGPEAWSLMRKLTISLLAPYWKDHMEESFGNLMHLCSHSIDFLFEILTKKPKEIDPPGTWLKLLGQQVTSLKGGSRVEAAM